MNRPVRHWRPELRTVDRRMVAVAVLSAAAAVGIGVLLGPQRARIIEPLLPEWAERTLSGEELSSCSAWYLSDGYRRRCYGRELLDVVDKRGIAAIATIEQTANRERTLGNGCHAYMHGVGRAFARRHQVRPATIDSYLSTSPNTNCAAGFTHGLITQVLDAPMTAIDARTVNKAVCAGQPTRFLRYSCIHGLGHAFGRSARNHLDRTMELCDALGVGPRIDCAAGGYHEFWFGVTGFDTSPVPPGDAPTDPAAFCAAQARWLAVPCWARAVQNMDIRVPDTAAAARLCDRAAAGVQHRACITGAVWMMGGSSREKLLRCDEFDADDVVACVQGIQANDPRPQFMRGCDELDSARTIVLSCYRILGQLYAVVTEGSSRDACSVVDGLDAQRACHAGSRRLNDPLPTFA